MSDLMLHAVLSMPPELWGYSKFDIAQRHSRYLQASCRIESDGQEIERLKEQVSAMGVGMSELSPDAGIFLFQQAEIARLKNDLADLRAQAEFFDRRHTALLTATERRGFLL